VLENTSLSHNICWTLRVYASCILFDEDGFLLYFFELSRTELGRLEVWNLSGYFVVDTWEEQEIKI